jgi:hypothetical protein
MRHFRTFFILIVAITSATTLADGFAVDKVYHPYVEPTKQEFEWRAVIQNEETGNKHSKQLHRLAYGRAFGERWAGEIYLIGEKADGEALAVEAYEVEAKRQLTEQGEYWADWGLLFEVEKERSLHIWEAATGVLMEKETGRFSTRANLKVIREWGDDIKDEWETSLALQTRYRYSQYFEPALEFHSAQDTRALGPVVMGDVRLGMGRRLHWEVGAFVGLDNDTPDSSMRAGLEYEF